MIIQYYADSLGLSRPNHVLLNERYIHIFIQWLKNQKDEEIFLIDRSFGGATIKDLYNIFLKDEEYVVENKDILIIHEGICDCSPRPISPIMRKIISLLPSYFRLKVIRFIHNNRSKLLKFGFKYYHTKKVIFEEILRAWLETALKKYSRIYIFNIAPTNQRIENHSPGLSKSISNYNESISKVVTSFLSDKIYLIDIHTLIKNSKESFDELIIESDGHHITAKAHSLYAQKLIEIEAKIK